MDRGPVNIREGKIGELIQLYQSTYRKLEKEILTATEVGKIQKARTMARIKSILTEFGAEVADFVDEEIPKYYYDGANIASQDLKNLGVTVGRNIAIDKAAIASLVYDTKLSFAESITAMYRSSARIVSNALKQQIQLQIAEGKLKGDTLKMITSDVKRILQEEGITALIDKGGKRWTFEHYAETLVRTKAVEARNNGLENRALSSGYDLVQISNHNSQHEACHVWEGKILSISGSTPKGTKLPGGYIVAGTLQEAREAGLFHPNCKHAANIIIPELAAKTKAYNNPFNK